MDGNQRLVAFAATLTLFLDLAATTVVVPLLPTYGLTTAYQTSIVFLSKPVSEMLANLLTLGPSVADYMGSQRPATVGLLLVSASCVLLVSTDFAVLVTGRVLGGLGASLCVPAMLKLVSHSCGTDERLRDRIVALALAGDALGGVVGPVMGSGFFAVASSFGASTSTSRAASLSVISGLCLMASLSLVFVRDLPNGQFVDPGDHPATLSLQTILRRRGVGLIAVAGLAFGATAFQIGVLEATTPFLLTSLGEAASGFLWALVGIGFCIFAPIAVWFMNCLSCPPFCCPTCAVRIGHQENAAGADLQPDGGLREAADLSSLDPVCGNDEHRSARCPSSSAVALRHAWASVLIGSVCLLGYASGLHFLSGSLSPQTAVPGGSAPSAAWIAGFGVGMTILGAALGMIYVPINMFTRDLTLQILDQSALSRTLGFLQGCKNCGLVVGYAVGPALVHIHTSSSNSIVGAGMASGFSSLSLVLVGSGSVVMGTAVCLRTTGKMPVPGTESDSAVLLSIPS